MPNRHETSAPSSCAATAARITTAATTIRRKSAPSGASASATGAACAGHSCSGDRRATALDGDGRLGIRISRGGGRHGDFDDGNWGRCRGQPALICVKEMPTFPEEVISGIHHVINHLEPDKVGSVGVWRRVICSVALQRQQSGHQEGEMSDQHAADTAPQVFCDGWTHQYLTIANNVQQGKKVTLESYTIFRFRKCGARALFLRIVFFFFLPATNR
jgi:hypothetical protein